MNQISIKPIENLLIVSPYSFNTNSSKIVDYFNSQFKFKESLTDKCNESYTDSLGNHYKIVETLFPKDYLVEEFNKHSKLFILSLSNCINKDKGEDTISWGLKPRASIINNNIIQLKSLVLTR